MPNFANPQSLNRYSYVLNNPLRYTDPTGHKADAGGADGACNKKCKESYEQQRQKNKQKENSTPAIVPMATPAFNVAAKSTPIPPSTLETAANPVSSLTATSSSMTLPFTTQTPEPPRGWVPSGDPKWFQYVDEQDMILDVSGLGLDLITSGVGGRVTNSIEVVGRALDLTDATVGAIQTVNDNRSGNADWYTYSSFATDLAGLYIPIAPDAVGIGLNIVHAHQLANLDSP